MIRAINKYWSGAHFSISNAYTSQKMKFPIKYFLRKCDQTAGNCGFGHIYWRNSSWKTYFLCGVGFKTSTWCIFSQLYDFHDDFSMF